jgi:sugar/nucleoside kinase (ribokinase family)
MTGRLIQLSGVIVDMVYWVNTVPLPGQEAEVHSASLTPGGGFNAMIAARRAGMDVGYGGTLGSGPMADFVAQALTREGIEVLRPRLSTNDQGCCTVLVDRTGERTFIASAGAEGIVSDDNLAAIAHSSDDWLLMSGYGLAYPASRDALGRWLSGLASGSRLVFDPGPRVAAIPPPVLTAALGAARWVSANAAEAAYLTEGMGPVAAAQTLARDRPAMGGAVVRDGAEGCWVAPAHGTAHHIAGHAVQTVDTNGAGDAHVGHFIAALARGDDATTAARFANIAAALSTTLEGPATAPTRAEVLTIMTEDRPTKTKSGR